ncbi:G-box-binding factor 1-like isoform X2 [Andrographis paniculata]|uniref:G-box-binding factor 1-like isoform X2 n=1 Tax=Andrographis paniculata TaxID=175694 RepID=UPI0021E724C9|nr:G-box-binding factor 1-like isoform X2 [Andrographis paniculata]
MEAGEESTPTKSSKPSSSAPEAPVTPTTPAYPDWQSSMQAFYSAGAAPPFFASTVASPTPHPYMWGTQHPLMPPYGTPVPYPALYPPGGVYTHPNMVTAPGVVPGTADLDGKSTVGKDHALGKQIKGTSGNHVLAGSKMGDIGKVASGSGNDAGTQSAESGSEGSSDASNDDNNQGLSAAKKGSFDQMLADGASGQSNGASTSFQSSVPAMKMHPNVPVASTAIGQSGVMNDRWLQDDRELKRQKRKQSNRESARRSRLRKQAECEDLQRTVETLNNENHTLREELQRISEECQKLTSENHSIKDELIKLCGPDIVSKLESNSGTDIESRGDEGNQ